MSNEKASLLNLEEAIENVEGDHGSGDDVIPDQKIEMHGLSEPGIYASVLIAAFGGLHIQVEKRGMIGRSMNVMVHPFLMWLMCIPIFLVQVSAILALRFDLDVTSSISEGAEHKSQALNDLVWYLKLLMVTILQLSQFSDLAESMRYMAFVFNPICWVETRHPGPGEWLSTDVAKRFPWMRIFFRPVFLFPWPALALLMRLVVSYLVCIDSVSLILSSRVVRDAIFNSLAMTFIIELNRVYFTVCCIAFHLRVTEEPLKLNKRCWKNKKDAGDRHEFTNERKDELSEYGGLPPSAYEWMVNKLPFLRRGHGARTYESIIVAVLLFCVYFQQMQVVLFAYKTDTLPVARDICTQHRWLNHEASYFKFAGEGFEAFQSLLFVNAADATHDVYNSRIKDGVVRHANATGIIILQKNLNRDELTWRQKGCVREDGSQDQREHGKKWEMHPYADFYRMTFSDRKQLLREGPVTHTCGTLFLMLLLLGSQGALWMHDKWFGIFTPPSDVDLADDVDKEQDMKILVLERKVRQLERALGPHLASLVDRAKSS